MVLKPGDKIHVITRRIFPEDVARHFIGEVVECDECVARVQGFPFCLDTTTQTFVRKRNHRTRLVPLTDAGLIITVLESDVDHEALRYEDVNGRLVLTDGNKIKLDLTECRAGA